LRQQIEVPPPRLFWKPDLGSDPAAVKLTEKELIMSATMDTAREVFVSGLRNQHAMENQAIELLER
jgi:hypothetical protein